MRFKKLNHLAKTPTRGSEYAAGLDLYAATSYDIEIEPGQMIKIDTGLAMEIPNQFFGAIYPRSGLATKQGLRLANCTGIIDADYRGPIVVPIYNDSDKIQIIPAGSRIAQLVIQPYCSVLLEEVGELGETERGESGFGSTGVK